MSVDVRRATLNAVTSWLREAREQRGLAALPLGARERAHSANERFRRRIRGARLAHGGQA